MLIIAICAFPAIAKLYGLLNTNIFLHLTIHSVFYLSMIKLKYACYLKSHGIQQKLAMLCYNCFSPQHQLYSRICKTQTPTKIMLVLNYEKYLEQQYTYTEYGSHSMFINCCVAL